MALIGLGAQSEFQAVAFHALLGIEELVVYDVDPAATDKFRRNLDARDIRVRVAASAPEATEGADIITTATADKRSEEHTSELQSLMRISYAVFCLKKKNNTSKISNIIDHEKTNTTQTPSQLSSY